MAAIETYGFEWGEGGRRQIGFVGGAQSEDKRREERRRELERIKRRERDEDSEDKIESNVGNSKTKSK